MAYTHTHTHTLLSTHSRDSHAVPIASVPLLQAFSRRPPKQDEEVEFTGNQFDSLCAALTFAPNRPLFLEAGGVKAMIELLRWGRETGDGWRRDREGIEKRWMNDRGEIGTGRRRDRGRRRHSRPPSVPGRQMGRQRNREEIEGATRERRQTGDTGHTWTQEWLSGKPQL